jgi:glutamate-1-semialdehyde 2,1-aminomutase
MHARHRDTTDPLVRRERRRLVSRLARSRRAHARASRSIPGGVCSAAHAGGDAPILIERGRGARVWDLDGNEYVDMHAGYGSMVAGHAHPAIARAVGPTLSSGTCFGAPSPHAMPVAEELRSRFGLPLWRFTNSGTEATMAAVRIARAFTGRSVLLKVEGAYHGHHDGALVSVTPAADEAGDAAAPRSVPVGDGIPETVTRLTRVVSFNDVAALRSLFLELRGQIAGVIVELPLLNPTMVLPDAAFLDALSKVRTEHGALLILDEVKTGLVVARGGASELYGISPDLVTLAKALGGGLPCGAVGGRKEVMEIVAGGCVGVYGTFNGNPAAMAAARASMSEILTPAAYERLARMGSSVAAAFDAIIARYELSAVATVVGAKGALAMLPERPRSYRDWLRRDRALSELFWLYQLNRGVYLSPAPSTKWTLTVAHEQADIDRFVANFHELARELQQASVWSRRCAGAE